MPREITLASPGALSHAVAHVAMLLGDTWRSITARQLWTVVLLALAYTGILTLGALPMLLQRRVWSSAVNALLSSELSGLAVLYAVVLVERGGAAVRLRWWPYALAVASGVAVATLLNWLISQCLIGITTAYVEAGSAEPFGNFVLRHWLHASLVCGLGTAVYVARKRAAQRTAALGALQKERSESEKLLLKTRLAALQARVEPRFLLDTLGRVERLYERDARAADGLLRHLVRYLRAALPQMREMESTLGRETKLVDAYLAVHKATRGARLRTTLAGGATEHTSVPPMLLLPLIDHALAAEGDREGGGRELTIEAIIESDRLRIAVRDTGDGFAPERAINEAIALLRERLRALYADSASLSVQRTGSGSAAVIDIPAPLSAAPSTQSTPRDARERSFSFPGR